MGKAFDAYAAKAVAENAGAIVEAGYVGVGLYYFRTSGFKQLLTADIASALSAAGLFIFSAYESGEPVTAAYFTTDQANADAHVAAVRAIDAGQPGDTPIYFAVDYDASPDDLPAIRAYFAEITRVFGVVGSPHKIGVYGSGLVCRHLSDAGLPFTWLSQSRGFAGYNDWKPRANIVQGPVSKFGDIDIDTDTTFGNSGAWKIGQ